MYLIIGKVLAPAQWLVVMALTQKDKDPLTGTPLDLNHFQESVIPFLQSWELGALAFVAFVVAYNIAGPALVGATSCKSGVTTIIT